MRHIMHWVVFALLLTDLLPGELAGSRAAAADDLQPKLLAVLIKNDAAASSPHAERARWGAQAVGAKLRDLGYAFLEPQDDGTCAATDRRIVDIGIERAQAALSCVDTVVGRAEIVFLHYSGPLVTVGNTNFLLPPGAGAPAGQEPRLSVAELLQNAAAKSRFVSVIIIDALEPAPTEADARAQRRFVRVDSPAGGGSSLIRRGGEVPEPAAAS